eukprot:760439-Rhodomonas_salina.1
MTKRIGGCTTLRASREVEVETRERRGASLRAEPKTGRTMKRKSKARASARAPAEARSEGGGAVVVDSERHVGLGRDAVGEGWRGLERAGVERGGGGVACGDEPGTVGPTGLARDPPPGVSRGT